MYLNRARSHSHSACAKSSQVILGGSRVDLIDRSFVLETISTALSTGMPIAVASANLDHIFHFGTNGTSRAEFDEGPLRWLTTLDGAPLALRAATLTGRRFSRQAGSDLLLPILDLANRARRRVGFLGGTPEMHQMLRSRLAAAYPGLPISGYWAPSRAELNDPRAADALAADVRRVETDIVVVGLGKPRQELWIERYSVATAAKVFLAFGASADFLAGAVNRAPRIFRGTGCEWVYRLVREPRRMRTRYLVEGPRALGCLIRDSHSSRPVLAGDQRTAPNSVTPEESAEVFAMALGGQPR